MSTTVIKATTDTYLKSENKDSSQLTESEKFIIKKDTVLELTDITDLESKHYGITLKEPIGNFDYQSCYVFAPHWGILASDDPDLNQESPLNPNNTSTSNRIPQSGIDLIKEFEGYHEKQPDGSAKAYKDPIYGWGVPTIGYGTTKYPNGSRVRQGDIISQAKAEEYLSWEVEGLCKPNLEKISTWSQMNDNQRGALYSFAYNLGAHFYGGSNFQSITKVCNSPDKWNNSAWVEEQFVKYCNPRSPAEQGLRRRRKAEAKLFCTPI